MSKRKQVLGASVLTTAVVAALSAVASGHVNTGRVSPALARGTTAATAAASASGHAAQSGLRIGPLSSAPQQAQFDRFIVRFKDGSTAARSASAVINAFDANAQRAGVAGMKVGANGVATVLGAQHVRRMGIGADVIKLSRKLGAAEADALLAQLRADPAVAYAEPDLVLQPLDFVPNDTRFADLQWHYRNTSGAIPPGSPPNSAGGISLPKAWGVAVTNGGATVPTPNGAGVVVAVLDTGYVDHGDLDANLVPGYDFITDPAFAVDGGGRDADAHDPGDFNPPSRPNSSWHGTHVAGTIAAVTNNAKGVAGVAFNAKVMPVRVLGKGGGHNSDIADAITWASGGTVPGVPVNADPVEVINMSLGGSGSCTAGSAMQTAIDGAISRGTVVVVAAGNNNSDASFFTPASCAGVINVGSTGVDGSKSSFSNFGLSVSLSAPGGGAASSGSALAVDNVIWSTGNSGTTTPVASADGGDVLIGMVGTSMASPHVAGVVALMQSTAVASGLPALSPALVRQVLTKTARNFPSAVAPVVPMGVGIVDANAAVIMSKAPVVADPATTLTNRLPKQITSTSKMPVYNLTAGTSNLFVLNNVPVGKPSLNIRTYGGTSTSDVAIYVKRDAAPTTTDFDFKSEKVGTTETVMLTNPAAGNYYVLVVNTKASADEFVLAAY